MDASRRLARVFLMSSGCHHAPSTPTETYCPLGTVTLHVDFADSVPMMMGGAGAGAAAGAGAMVRKLRTDAARGAEHEINITK